MIGLSDRFFVSSAAFVLLVREHFPVGDITCVGLHNGGSLDTFYSVLAVVGMLLGDNNSIDAQALIVGSHADKQEVECLHLFRLQGAQNSDPTEGEESAFAAAQSVRNIRHTESDANNLVLVVDHDGYKVEVQEWEIGILVMLLLPGCHGLEVIELLVRDIEHIHILITILPLQLFGRVHLINAQVIALAHKFVDTQYALGRIALRVSDLDLDPVVLLGESVSLNVLLVIREVLQRRHRREVLKSLDEQSLVIPIGEADRTVELCHAFAFAPCSNSIEQSTADLVVIDKIDPAEANLLNSPALVSNAVDDSGYASDNFTVAVSEVLNGLADIMRRVLGGVERIHLVQQEVRTELLAVFIQIVTEFGKLILLPLGFYFLKNDCHVI